MRRFRNDMERAEELLQAALHAFNSIRNQRLPLAPLAGYTDTYALAAEIDRFFKDVREGAYNEE